MAYCGAQCVGGYVRMCNCVEMKEEDVWAGRE